jgi:hypothetical protein
MDGNAVLGYLLSRRSSRSQSSVASFAMLGFGFGIVSSSIIVWLDHHAIGGSLP